MLSCHFRSVTHRFHTLKLLSLLDLLQFAHVVQRLLLKVLPHYFHLRVCLERWRTHPIIIIVTGRSAEARKQRRNITILVFLVQFGTLEVYLGMALNWYRSHTEVSKSKSDTNV